MTQRTSARCVFSCINAAGYGWFSLASASLATFVQSRGCALGVSATALTFLADEDDEAVLRTILTQDPDLVGLSVYVWNETKTIRIAHRLRSENPNVWIIIGGPQVSRGSIQWETLLASGTVNALVEGDGEYAALEIAQELLRGAAPSPCWINAPIDDIDSLPNPYRHVQALRDEVRRDGIAIVECSRGCPFSCTFCDQAGKRLRTKSLSRVFEDIRYLAAIGAKRLIFLDPTFNYSRARMREILQYLAMRLPTVTYHAEIKADLLNDDDIDLLASIPHGSVEVGLQSANGATLKAIKRPTNLDKLGPNVSALFRRGVRVAVNTIYGLPGDTLEDWKSTVDYVYSLGDVDITATTLKVLPNTELDRTASELGVSFSPKFVVLRTPSMSSNDFDEARLLSSRLDHIAALDRDERSKVRQVVQHYFAGSLVRYLKSEAIRLPICAK